MNRLLSIQSLRGFAAFLVFLDHGLSRMRDHFAEPDKINQFAIQLGDCGVWIFFMISGFIMIHTSHDEFGTQQAWARFAYKRIIRIIPLYWIFTLVVFLLLWHRDGISYWSYLIQSLTFVPFSNLLTNNTQPLLSQGWTLDYEMLFYAIFSLCLVFSKRIGLVFFIAIMSAAVLVGLYLNPDQIIGHALTPLGYCTNTILAFFIAGVAMGNIYPYFVRRYPQGLPLHELASIALCAVAVAVAAGLFWFIDGTASRAALILAAFFCIIIIIAQLNYGKSVLARLFVRLGEISYSLYLTHGFCLDALLKITKKMQITISTPIYLAIGWGMAVIVAIVINRLIEVPVTRYLRRAECTT